MRTWSLMLGMALCLVACDSSDSGLSGVNGGGSDAQSTGDQFGLLTDAGIAPMQPTGPRIAYIAVGHRFSDEIGVPGQGISVFSMSETGALSQSAIRLEAPHPVTALGFAGDTGQFLVASERGAMSMYDARGETPTLLSSGQLDAAGVIAVVGGDTARVAVVNRDSSDTGGIYWMSTSEALDVFDYLPMSLAYTTRQCPGRSDWVVVGGQTNFEPVRAEDIHLVELGEMGASRLSQGDVTEDVFEVASVAVSADCRRAVYANRSIFADTFGRLSLVDLSQDVLERIHFLDTAEDISQVEYIQSLDLFLTTSFESETLSTYRVQQDELVLVDRLERQGLIAGVAVLPMDIGVRLVVASIHAADGSRIGTTQIGADGRIEPVNWRALGAGSENIPSVLSHSGWLPVQDGE